MATLERNNESTKEIHKFLSKQGPENKRHPVEEWEEGEARNHWLAERNENGTK